MGCTFARTAVVFAFRTDWLAVIETSFHMMGRKGVKLVILGEKRNVFQVLSTICSHIKEK